MKSTFRPVVGAEAGPINRPLEASSSSPTLAEPTAREHLVQFFENDGFLVESVARFIGEGLGGGDGALVIATRAHREALEERLEAQGIDLTGVQARGRYVALDALELLSKFIVNGMPDEGRFLAEVGGLVGQMTAAFGGLRAFGEMVALLLAQRNEKAAVRLEELWNDLAKAQPFSLFCAYPLQAFRGRAKSEAFAQVCRIHSSVLPAESCTAMHSSNEAQLRAIALLQQRAASLEAEISERRRAEEALRRCHDELKCFFENATIGLHWVCQDGTVKWANRAEFELLGYSEAEYVGHHIAEFHADKEIVSDILLRLGRAETLRNYEARLRCKDGSLKHVLIDSSVFWDQGRFVHTQCFTRDVTEQKKAELELREARDSLVQANQALERRVAERTARLQEAMTELETFSYSISHDMRSPLRAMHAHATALLEDYRSKLDDAAIYSLERIARASTRLGALVRDVLAYSKVSKGNIDLKPVDLGSVVEDIIRERFEGSRQCITVEHPLHTVLGHEAYLLQCLTNLIDNALKFVAPGKVPKVRVRTEIAGDSVKVWVSDNGVGIHREHYGRLFQIFGRVHSQDEYAGTGIGLCIVRKAVSRMGGTIGFNSEPGKGSEFWLTLPALRA